MKERGEAAFDVGSTEDTVYDGSRLGEPLLHVVLDRPAIAGNVGACVRLCAATGAALHVCGSALASDLMVEPTIESAVDAVADKEMLRAGLDYWPRARVHFHRSLDRCLALLGRDPWIVEVGGAHAPWEVSLSRGDVVVFGPEKGSVQEDVMRRFAERRITLPQRPGIRSLNLAQCAAVVTFEAVRQQAGGRSGSSVVETASPPWPKAPA